MAKHQKSERRPQTASLRDRDIVASMFQAIQRNARSVRDISRVTGVATGRMTSACKALEIELGLDLGSIFGRKDHKEKGQPYFGLTLDNESTRKAIAHLQKTGTTIPIAEDARDVVRIATENFLAIHLLPRAIGHICEISTGTHSPWIEVRETSNLFTGLDELVRNRTDLLLYTFRRPHGSKLEIPQFEGFQSTELTRGTGSTFETAVWFQKDADFATTFSAPAADYAIEDFAHLPVAFVDFADAYLLRGLEGKAARVFAETNEALVRLVATGKFVGLGTDWHPVAADLTRHGIELRKFSSPRKSIRVAAFYRQSKWQSQTMLILLDQLRKSFLPLSL